MQQTMLFHLIDEENSPLFVRDRLRNRWMNLNGRGWKVMVINAVHSRFGTSVEKQA